MPWQLYLWPHKRRSSAYILLVCDDILNSSTRNVATRLLDRSLDHTVQSKRQFRSIDFSIAVSVAVDGGNPNFKLSSRPRSHPLQAKKCQGRQGNSFKSGYILLAWRRGGGLKEAEYGHPHHRPLTGQTPSEMGLETPLRSSPTTGLEFIMAHQSLIWRQYFVEFIINLIKLRFRSCPTVVSTSPAVLIIEFACHCVTLHYTTKYDVHVSTPPLYYWISSIHPIQTSQSQFNDDGTVNCSVFRVSNVRLSAIDL